MAQVAWPRVHPSPLGEGEAPTAQEPQPEAEANAEETPEDTPATTPFEAPEEADGAVDTNYTADMAAAQSTWDPCPLQHKIHHCQPRMLPPHLRTTLHRHKKVEDRTLFIFLLFRFSFKFQF